jgi:hypothetical protein
LAHHHSQCRYGQTIWQEYLQSDETVLHGYNIPANQTGQTVRGAFAYVPIPVRANGTVRGKPVYAAIPSGDGWIEPRLSSDGCRLYVCYPGVFIAALSSSPFVGGTYLNATDTNQWARFFNIFGNGARGPLPVTEFLHFAVAVEPSAPSAHPGTSLAERCESFVARYDAMPVPRRIVADNVHPVFQYVNAKGVTMTLQFAHDNR